MLIFKVVFWLWAFASLSSLFDVCEDHPRQRTDVNIGTDLAIWIVQIILTIWMGFSLWGIPFAK